MNNPRFTGLLLLLIGVLVLFGNTLDVFPPQAFWAGLVMYPIGGYLFFVGSRRANDPAFLRAQRAAEARSGGAGERSAQAGADGEDARPVQTFDSISREIVAAARKPAEMPAASPAASPATSTDSGAPAPTRATASQPPGIAEQLAKLQKLHQQGIISADELAIAKAKLQA